MVAGAGGNDANGVFLYGEATPVNAQFSDYLNRLGGSLSTLITSLKNGTAFNTPTAYVPALTNITLGAAGASNDVTYQRLGKSVRVWGRLKFGAGGTLSGGEPRIALPFAAATRAINLPIDAADMLGTTGTIFPLSGRIFDANSVVITRTTGSAPQSVAAVDSANPTAIGANAEIRFSFWYEAA